MPKLRAHTISVSVDGFMAGPDQDLENPLGVGGEALHAWIFPQKDSGRPVDPSGPDADFLLRRTEGVGATVMGRNMFGPVRGEWPDESWRGWWGEDPPFHHPTFVLTHHAREPLTMDGGTTFHFITDGLESAVEQAFDAADGQDVVLGGGASTIRAALQVGLLDELHVAIVPVLLGRGEPLFSARLPPSYVVVEHVPSDSVTHVVIAKRESAAT
ncbi:dihydrofolate reductase family protein [Mumia sp. Pv 4-285]|uniref:dihydrofolate reductase family protein n=1 Tax=Mumia qirimensis TaxID=3234852 RepID=UPI00351D7DC8